MSFDPWLKIIKDRDDQFAVAVACALFLLAHHWGWTPTPEPWMLLLAWAGMFLFGCLIGVKFLLILVWRLLGSDD
jgi:hypothetical protein